jgi:EAL domain-containing protein (putative c-di-GMP-specific phosphodiesterase class I)
VVATDTKFVEFLRNEFDLSRLLSQMVAEIELLVEGCEGVTIEIPDTEGYLVYVHCSGFLKPYLGLTVKLDESISGKAFKSVTVQISQDALNDPYTDKRACEIVGIRSMVLIPLVYHAQPVGVLKLASKKVNGISTRQIKTVELLSEFIAFVVSSVSDLERITDKLTTGQDYDADNGENLTQRVSEFVTKVLAPDMYDRMQKRAVIENIMRADEHRIVVQPVFDLNTGQIRKFEALSRFGDTSRGPDTWFNEAHELDIGIELELFAIKKALRILHFIPDNVSLAINASASSIVSDQFGDLILSADMPRIIVELTEHNPVENYDELTSKINDLRQAGVRLSVDDMGAGISSLSHILKLAPDFIKLDRFLISKIHDDPARLSLANALRIFSQKTGYKLVAEGIETAEELKVVSELGIELGQGYFLAMPGDLDEFYDDASKTVLKKIDSLVSKNFANSKITHGK